MSTARDIVAHGAKQLPAVEVESYNVELQDADGFVGDQASRGAFLKLVDELRDKSSEPIDLPTGRLSNKKIDALLAKKDSAQAAIIHGAIEEFAERLAAVARRFMKLKEWRDVERIVIGGGFRSSRAGKLAIRRAEHLLRSHNPKVGMAPMTRPPQKAGLIGAVHLAPSWMFEAFDSIVAVDIGGSNIRCGVVNLNLSKAPDLSRATVGRIESWRHAEHDPSRDEAVDRLAKMIRRLIRGAEGKINLAPFVGVGCPGVIQDDGSIERGAQNLPGNWSSKRFNLVDRLKEAIPTVEDRETMIVLHNDAVVQGLSEVPFARDAARWAALTIGTGLGNASFSNRPDPAEGG